MPRMRSVFSSSVTTRRVWPDCTQRFSAVSTFSDTSTVTTAGIGVITLRASCSCRWKTPRSITASPGSSVPPEALRAIRNLRSSEVVISSPSPSARMPNGLRIRRAAADSTIETGLKTTLENCSSRAERSITFSGKATV